METLVITLGEYWPLIVSVLGSYAWLIRVESRGINNTKSLEKSNKALEKANEKWSKELFELEQRLIRQRTEDVQSRRDRDLSQQKVFEEIHNDIKELLQRTSKNESR